MSKRVVVIASGETERRALPFLVVGHLAKHGVVVEDVRIPPQHKAINAEVAEKIIRSVWFEREDVPPRFLNL